MARRAGRHRPQVRCMRGAPRGAPGPVGAREGVCVGSFSDRRLRRIRALGRGWACTSMGAQAVALGRLTTVSGLMRRLGADCIQVPISRGPSPIVTKRFIAAAHTAGLPVQVGGSTMRRRSTNCSTSGRRHHERSRSTTQRRTDKPRRRTHRRIHTARSIHPPLSAGPPRQLSPHNDRITQSRGSEPRRRCTIRRRSMVRVEVRYFLLISGSTLARWPAGAGGLGLVRRWRVAACDRSVAGSVVEVHDECFDRGPRWSRRRQHRST